MTLFPLLSDALLLIATLALALYCWALSRRLRAFNDMDSGLEGTIKTLSEQVDDLKAALDSATNQNAEMGANLDQVTQTATDSIGRLEMLIAAAEDVAVVPAEEPEAEAETFVHFRARRDGSRDTI